MVSPGHCRVVTRPWTRRDAGARLGRGARTEGRRMRAAVLREIPGALAIEDVDIDVPDRREVLVRTVAAGCCHSDLHFMDGKYVCPTPVVLGHESAGIVEAVGSDVTYVKPGDHVITCLSVFCGTCDNCTTGRPGPLTHPTGKKLPG